MIPHVCHLESSRRHLGLQLFRSTLILKLQYVEYSSGVEQHAAQQGLCLGVVDVLAGRDSSPPPINIL